MPVDLRIGGFSNLSLAMNYTDTKVTERGVFSPLDMLWALFS